MTVGRQHEARVALEREIGFVYVAEFFGLPIVKIGFSLALARRAKTLFKKKTYPGRFLASMPGRIADERALHRALAEYRGPKDAPYHCSSECYPRSILNHPAIPAELRSPA